MVTVLTVSSYGYGVAWPDLYMTCGPRRQPYMGVSGAFFCWCLIHYINYIKLHQTLQAYDKNVYINPICDHKIVASSK